MIQDNQTKMDYIENRSELSERIYERELKCPECNYLVAYAFSDAKGHLKIKCRKCKAILVLDLVCL